MKPTVPPEPRCELCGLKRSAPRHRNGDMQSFHRFEEPAPAAVPPELAPPTLDPTTLVWALEAAKAESVAVYKEYNERIDGFLKRGGTVRDEVYRELNIRVDAAMWSSQRVSEIVDLALTGTPTPAAAPPTVAPARTAREVAHEEARKRATCDFGGFPFHPPNALKHSRECNLMTCAVECDRAVRSTEVAPARETVCAVTEEHNIGAWPVPFERLTALLDDLVTMLERDRASRSPGDELAAARRVIYVLGGEVGVARGLLTASDLGNYCGYDHAAETCPMPLPCWRHRRNAYLAAGPGKAKR